MCDVTAMVHIYEAAIFLRHHKCHAAVFQVVETGCWQIIVISTFPDWSASEKTTDSENLKGHRAMFQGEPYLITH